MYVLMRLGGDKPEWLGDNPAQAALVLDKLPDKAAFTFWHYPYGFGSGAVELPLPTTKTPVVRRLVVNLVVTLDVGGTLGKYPRLPEIKRTLKDLLPPGMLEYNVHPDMSLLETKFVEQVDGQKP